MNKKGDVWISAVIYIALAVTILAIVLAAGLPVVNRMRDKNAATQTKEIMHELDATIRDVLREGPGSRRTPVIKIGKGEFTIDDSEIKWEFKNSKFMFSEPGAEIREGNLVIKTEKSNVEGEYDISIKSSYNDVQFDTNIKTLLGQYNLAITDSGPVLINGVTKTKVTINELTI